VSPLTRRSRSTRSNSIATAPPTCRRRFHPPRPRGGARRGGATLLCRGRSRQHILCFWSPGSPLAPALQAPLAAKRPCTATSRPHASRHDGKRREKKILGIVELPLRGRIYGDDHDASTISPPPIASSLKATHRLVGATPPSPIFFSAAHSLERRRGFDIVVTGRFVASGAWRAGASGEPSDRRRRMRRRERPRHSNVEPPPSHHAVQ